jgi:hypothetical protein
VLKNPAGHCYLKHDRDEGQQHVSSEQGCQMEYFHTKNENWEGIGMEHFTAIWYSLWPFGIFYGHLVNFMAIWYVLCGHLVYFCVVIWYIVLVI